MRLIVIIYQIVSGKNKKKCKKKWVFHFVKRLTHSPIITTKGHFYIKDSTEMRKMDKTTMPLFPLQLDSESSFYTELMDGYIQKRILKINEASLNNLFTSSCDCFTNSFRIIKGHRSLNIQEYRNYKR